MTTLFDRLGGQAAIDAFVPLFYEKVLADDRINQFFRGVNMDRLREMQKRLLNNGLWWP